jgi:hypothetical protein
LDYLQSFGILSWPSGILSWPSGIFCGNVDNLVYIFSRFGTLYREKSGTTDCRRKKDCRTE